MKKTFQWLDDNGIPYDFHDYKKKSPDNAVLKQAIESHGWDNVINRKGMTWRKLPDETKEKLNEINTIELVNDNPSLIKRPLIAKGDEILLGFDQDIFEEKLK
jgi:Spx/MgsR family transcriptional regulator